MVRSKYSLDVARLVKAGIPLSVAGASVLPPATDQDATEALLEAVRADLIDLGLADDAGNQIFQPPNNWRQTNGDNYREVPPMTDDKDVIEFAKKLRYGPAGATTTHSEPVSEEIANLRNEGFASGPSGKLHIKHGPVSPKVTADELFAAFNTFHRSTQSAMKYWHSVSAETMMAQARDVFRAFCEDHGLAEHIDWTPPEG